MGFWDDIDTGLGDLYAEAGIAATYKAEGDIARPVALLPGDQEPLELGGHVRGDRMTWEVRESELGQAPQPGDLIERDLPDGLGAAGRTETWIVGEVLPRTPLGIYPLRCAKGHRITP